MKSKVSLRRVLGLIFGAVKLNLGFLFLSASAEDSGCKPGDEGGTRLASTSNCQRSKLSADSARRLGRITLRSLWRRRVKEGSIGFSRAAP